jgi:predicted NUDIX family phosphoesterase
MAHFLDIAYKVFAHERKPLSPKELVALGQDYGLLVTEGKTPWQTMKSKLSTDILAKKDRSLFMRTNKGLFALREWGNETEYYADRYQKALLDEDIMVFPSNLLPVVIPSSGFFPNTKINGTEIISHCQSMSRRRAEADPNYIQIISGFLVRYKNSYLTYKRTKRLPEQRLHGFYSILFGGHLNPDDFSPLFDVFDPEYATLMLQRELREEVQFQNPPKISYKGLLYDDTVEISKQHICVIFDVLLQNEGYNIGERGFLINSKFESLDEIISRIVDFENWSVSIINYERSR